MIVQLQFVLLVVLHKDISLELLHVLDVIKMQMDAVLLLLYQDVTKDITFQPQVLVKLVLLDHQVVMLVLFKFVLVDILVILH